MFRFLIPLALVATFAAAESALPVAQAQPYGGQGQPYGGQGQPYGRQGQGQPGDDISGIYINRSNGGECRVEPRGRTFLFINENGTPASFAYVGPGRLQMVGGDWDPNVVVSVLHDRFGRQVLRFDSGNSPPGYWAWGGR